MKKIILFTTLLVLATANIFSLEVDKSELENASNNTTIEFINYTGPHKKIDSLSAIKGIGSTLGNVIAKQTDKSSTAGSTSKYYVIHAIDPSEKGKLDADIIMIGKDATVDHIVNLRRIISAYLSSAYGYSEKDADTLAVFITVYNAVYRGKFDSFQNKYKSVVVKNLSNDNCGLSVNYEEWPGKSEIVIPLFDINEGGLSTVDTSVISDTKVVESMKEDDDMNIESRKNMVDLKEREAEDASDKAKQSQKNATEEQKKLDEEKAKTAQAQKEADEAQKKADEAAKTAKENPDDKEAQNAAKEAQEEADKKQSEAEQQAEKQAEQQEKTDAARETAEEKQKVADKKTSESQSERKDIAKDQQAILEKEISNANAPTEYGIVLADESKMLSRLVKFNSNNGDIIKNSPVSLIRNRTIFKAGDNYLAIAGENKGNGAVKLVLLDTENLEITSESTVSIAEDSVLVQDGSDYYSIVDENGKFFVGKFDSTLAMKLKSTTEVKSCTPITVTSNGIVITDSTGKLKVLDKKDLSDISK